MVSTLCRKGIVTMELDPIVHHLNYPLQFFSIYLKMIDCMIAFSLVSFYFIIIFPSELKLIHKSYPHIGVSSKF